MIIYRKKKLITLFFGWHEIVILIPEWRMLQVGTCNGVYSTCSCTLDFVFYKQCIVHGFVAHPLSSLANRNVYAIHPKFLQPQNDPLKHLMCFTSKQFTQRTSRNMIYSLWTSNHPSNKTYQKLNVHMHYKSRQSQNHQHTVPSHIQSLAI
jgi:hypothetical protein